MRISITSAFLLLSSLYSQVAAFPAYGSLAGLSQREITEFARTVNVTGAGPIPGPLNDTSSKRDTLVNAGITGTAS